MLVITLLTEYARSSAPRQTGARIRSDLAEAPHGELRGAWNDHVDAGHLPGRTIDVSRATFRVTFGDVRALSGMGVGRGDTAGGVCSGADARFAELYAQCYGAIWEYCSRRVTFDS